jgi:hypothetical protein
MSTRVFKQSIKKGRESRDKNEKNINSILPNINTSTSTTNNNDELLVKSTVITHENLENDRAKSPIITGNSNYNQSGFVTYIPKNSVIMKSKSTPNIVHTNKKIEFAKKSDIKFVESSTIVAKEENIENNTIDVETNHPDIIKQNTKKAPWKQCKKEFYDHKSIYSQNEILHINNLTNDLSDEFFNNNNNWTHEFTLNLDNEINHHHKSRRNFPLKPYNKISISIFSEPADATIISAEKVNKLKIDMQNYFLENQTPVKLSSMLRNNLSRRDESTVKKIKAPSIPLLKRQKSSVKATFSGRDFEL